MNPDAPFIEKIEYTSDAYSGWIKKQSDKNCLSANPEDCLVWCLVEVPEKTFTHYIVDTTMTDEYEYRSITYYINDDEQKAGTEWREVVCNSNFTISLVSKVKNELIIRGYDVGHAAEDNVMDSELKAALVQFQKDYGLPIGNLDFETLEALGIEW